MTATVTVSVSDECEDAGCDDAAKYAYIVTGELGTDGIVVYCATHAEGVEDSPKHTILTTVDR